MTTLNKPKNDWAKAIYILYDAWYGGVSMAKILTQYDSTFYKWQTRIAEVEKVHPKLQISRVSIPYTSKIDGKKKHYVQYTPISPRPYVINLYNIVNKQGLKTKTNGIGENKN